MYTKGDAIRWRNAEGTVGNGEVLGFYNSYIVREPDGRVVLVSAKEVCDEDNR